MEISFGEESVDTSDDEDFVEVVVKFVAIADLHDDVMDVYDLEADNEQAGYIKKYIFFFNNSHDGVKETIAC